MTVAHQISPPVRRTRRESAMMACLLFGSERAAEVRRARPFGTFTTLIISENGEPFGMLAMDNANSFPKKYKQQPPPWFPQCDDEECHRVNLEQTGRENRGISSPPE